MANPNSNPGVVRGVTAKVRCTSKLIMGSGEYQTTTVGFQPDYAEGRNKEWAAATPTLDLKIGLKGDLADRFELDESYTLTLTTDTTDGE